MLYTKHYHHDSVLPLTYNTFKVKLLLSFNRYFFWVWHKLPSVYPIIIYMHSFTESLDDNLSHCRKRNHIYREKIYYWKCDFKAIYGNSENTIYTP